MPEEVKDPYTESYIQKLMTIHMESNSMLMDWNTVKVTLLPKGIYWFNAIPMQNSNGIFHNNPRICIESKMTLKKAMKS